MAFAVEGVCLEIAFGVTNGSSVLRSTITRDVAATAPTQSDLIAEIDSCFVGQLVNLSYKRAELSFPQKAAITFVPAYKTRYSYNGRISRLDRPDISYGFSIEGVGPWVGAPEIENFVKTFLTMPDGSEIETVYVSARRVIA